MNYVFRLCVILAALGSVAACEARVGGSGISLATNFVEYKDCSKEGVFILDCVSAHRDTEIRHELSKRELEDKKAHASYLAGYNSVKAAPGGKWLQSDCRGIYGTECRDGVAAAKLDILDHEQRTLEREAEETYKRNLLEAEKNKYPVLHGPYYGGYGGRRSSRHY